MTAGCFLLWWAVSKPRVAKAVLESDRYPEALHRDSFIAGGAFIYLFIYLFAPQLCACFIVRHQ